MSDGTDENCYFAPLRQPHHGAELGGQRKRAGALRYNCPGESEREAMRMQKRIAQRQRQCPMTALAAGGAAKATIHAVKSFKRRSISCTSCRSCTDTDHCDLS